MAETTNPLVGRYLTDYQMVTAAGSGPEQVFSDMLLRYSHVKKLNGIDLMKGTEAITASAALVGASRDFKKTYRLSDLIVAALEASLPLPHLDESCALFVTTEAPLNTPLVSLLQFERAGQVWHCHSEPATFAAMQQAQQLPVLTRWVWLALDSHCTMDWLFRQETLFSDPFPNGPVPGEALVVTEWQQHPNDHAPRLTALDMAEEPAHGHQVHQKTETRARLLRQVDEHLAEQSPPWNGIITNDDISPAMAAEAYKTEVDLWPNYNPDPLKGEGSPFISSYPVLGDIGLATLPFSLVMAAQRLQHPIKQSDTAYAVVSAGRTRHVGRMDRYRPPQQLNQEKEQ
ncbi:MAG: hypothetical protein LAT65_08605 [Saccharospirillum sp.]|nr:hypothetical protein [Saccharospirillum sp.]